MEIIRLLLVHYVCYNCETVLLLTVICYLMTISYLTHTTVNLVIDTTLGNVT